MPKVQANALAQAQANQKLVRSRQVKSPQAVRHWVPASWTDQWDTRRLYIARITAYVEAAQYQRLGRLLLLRTFKQPKRNPRASRHKRPGDINRRRIKAQAQSSWRAVVSWVLRTVKASC